MTPTELILLGKGPLARLKPVNCAPWRGMESPSRPLFNNAQADENRRLYPHLFRS